MIFELAYFCSGSSVTIERLWLHWVSSTFLDVCSLGDKLLCEVTRE